MKLKKLLLLNSLFFLSFISCSEQKKSKEKTITVVEEKQKKDNNTNSISNIVSINKEDTIEQIILEKDANDNMLNNSNSGTKEISHVKKNEPVKVFNGEKYVQNELYIINPEQRINDSIDIFVSMYDRLIANLENKGITNQKEKDSIIWEHWQKQIMENDYRHKHISFSEYWKNKE